MTRSTLIFLKTLAWIACLGPLAVLGYDALTPVGLGADPSAHIELTTGYTTLVLLAVGLAITPVRRLIPRLGWLARFRRLVGLFAFFYATLHMLAYVALYSGFDANAIVTDIARRRFITVGVVAWVLLVPLAATSTTWAIRKMGGKRWNMLHRLVYLIAFLGLVHYWWQVKAGVLTPVPLTVVIWALLLVRMGFVVRKRFSVRTA